MELYLDSANLKEIEEGFKLGFLNGLTTTPTFMAYRVRVAVVFAATGHFEICAGAETLDTVIHPSPIRHNEASESPFVP